MTRDIIRTERIGPVTVIHLQDDRALNALGSALVAGLAVGAVAGLGVGRGVGRRRGGG